MSAAPTHLTAVPPAAPVRVPPGEFVADDPPVPAGAVRAVADEIAEAAATVAEDVEQIVEGAVGELLAGAGVAWGLVRDALGELTDTGVADLPRTVVEVGGAALAALAAETWRRGGAVAATTQVAGRHAAARAATAVLRIATADPSGRRS
ncbi:hypothetical protein GCM10023200_41200 [Actinomycetospora chlora]|uniref:Uncharacterized protein n=1 Tax=Actinomycetospora chlora TaxID=663608 RepID=A0ABP9BTU2_9PSEU